MDNDDKQHAGHRLATIPNMARMPAYRGAFSVSSLRHLVFQAKSRVNSRGDPLPGNGLEESGTIIRLGRKVLIDLDRFDAWMSSHRTSGDERGSFRARGGS